ncbi:MAG: tyramine oxidase subunit B [Oscillospiraceae bacterium]
MENTKIEFLYLNEEDMVKAGVMDMNGCIETMDEMFSLLYEGDYLMGGANNNSHGMGIYFPKESKVAGMPLHAPDKRFMAMPAYLGGRFHLTGVKWYGSNKENGKKGLPRSILTVMLNNVETGAPLALLSANLVSAMRTGAVPGVAAKYLARQEATSVCLIGPGVVNRTALMAYMQVRPHIDTVFLKGRGVAAIEAMKAFIAERFPQIQSVQVCDTVEQAVKQADIVSVAASASTDYPYIKGSWLKEGSVVLGPGLLTIDREFLVEKAKKVADNWAMYEVAAEERGNAYPIHNSLGLVGTCFLDHIHDGFMKREDILELGGIASGKQPGRRNNSEIFVVSINGMAVEDVAWGYVVYQKALKAGIGKKLKLWDAPQMK